MPFNFDNTLLTDFAKCEAAGVARHVFGLRGKGEKIAADIGNAYHAGLEQHFRGETAARVVITFQTEYDKIIPLGEQPEEPRFARENCTKIMEQYCKVRPVESFPFEAMEFEQVKGMPLDDSGEYVFWVKRDMLVKDRETGAVTPCDHKSTGKISTWWQKKFRLASQLSGYCWFSGQEQGVHCGKIWVNAVEVAKLPDSTRKCSKHGMKYLECQKEHCNFELLGYARTPEQLEKWKQDALILAKKVGVLKQAFGDIAMLPYAWRQGAFNEGCMFCEYAGWCALGFDASVADEFVVFEEWKPWDIDGTGA